MPVGGAAQAQLLHLLKLKLEIKQLRAAQQELKEEVREECDLKREAQRLQNLESELAQALANEGKLGTALCCAKPDWSGRSEGWSAWQPGTEVLYASRLPAAGQHAGQEAGSSAPTAPFSASDAVSCTSRPTQLQLYRQPFAQGGLQLAYYARDAAGGRFVLKRAIAESSKHQRNLRAAHAQACVASICGAVAQAFTQQGCCAAASSGGELAGYSSAQLPSWAVAPAEAGSRCTAGAGVAGAEAGGPPMRKPMAQLAYLSVSVMVLDDPQAPSSRAVFLKEPWLETGSSSGSKWVKWTLNDGQLLPEGEADDIIQAFTHFSLRFGQERLGYDMLVLDTQGVVARDGDHAVYTLTDPAICSPTKAHGPTDMGSPALATFLSQHQHSCGAACREGGCMGLSAQGQ